jgi:hypothetical protein
MSTHSTLWRLLFTATLSFCSIFAVRTYAATVTVQAVSESNFAQHDVPVTFGQMLKSGDAPAGSHLRATMAGKPIPIQVDRKATNDDGSLRHAVITVEVPKLPARERG